MHAHAMIQILNKQIIIVLMGLFGLIAFLMLFLSASVKKEVQDEVREALASKNTVEFKAFADNLTDQEAGIYGSWVYLRDITNDFQEGVFFFSKSIADEKDPSVSTLSLFSVHLITTKTEIIFYEISARKNKKVGKNRESYRDILDGYKNEKRYSDLKQSFKEIFQVEFNDTDLFSDELIYGDGCWYGGTDPEGRQQIDTWVASKNKSELLKWLTSANSVKQVYAVDGLIQLKKLGVELTDDELRIIDFIRNKAGVIHVCSGCQFGEEEIKFVLKEIKP